MPLNAVLVWSRCGLGCVARRGNRLLVVQHRPQLLIRPCGEVTSRRRGRRRVRRRRLADPVVEQQTEDVRAAVPVRDGHVEAFVAVGAGNARLSLGVQCLLDVRLDPLVEAVAKLVAEKPADLLL